MMVTFKTGSEILNNYNRRKMAEKFHERQVRKK